MGSKQYSKYLLPCGGAIEVGGAERVQVPTLVSLQKLSKVLHIHAHWQDSIYQGLKTWELRNQPWSFKGKIGLWHDSTLCGEVAVTGCSLIALRSDDGEWESYDTSEQAQNLSPLRPENMLKHRVPAETLKVLAQGWNRMYAWFLEEPYRYEQGIPIKIRKGCQKIQNMDPETWSAVWKDFQMQKPDQKPDVRQHTLPKRLTVLSVNMRDANKILEGDLSLLLQSYKPDKCGVAYLAFHQSGSAFLLGTVDIVQVQEIKSLPALRKLEREGYIHGLEPTSRHMLALKEGKRLQAWIIKDQQHLNPPFTWKTDALSQ